MSTYTPIATQTVASSTASVTFTSIPQNYTDLVLVFSGVGGNNISLQFNGDTSASYSITRIQGDGSTAGSSRYNSVTSMYGPYSATQNTTIWQIPNYTNETLYKTGLAKGGGAGTQVELYTGLWQKQNPITSITVVTPSANISAGSVISIYGIAAGNSSAKATGGNIVTTDGSYWYHTFTSSGTFIPSQALTCDYLVVAGGGGGGYDAGGGGGAGGLLTSIGGTPLSLTAQTYIATVGAGGTAGTANRGGNGGNSIFASITATGGGGGGSRTATYKIGANGGSAGGGSGDGGTGGTASPTGQGNNGGNGNASYTPGGGGGGAGAVGNNTTSETNPGSGGNGLSNSITGSSVTYAGGGGGGYNANNNGGTGGGGTGGRAGTGTSAAVAGTANLGGGGGGGSNSSWQINGAQGGSGVIIIRYAV